VIVLDSCPIKADSTVEEMPRAIIRETQGLEHHQGTVITRNEQTLKSTPTCQKLAKDAVCFSYRA